MRTFLLFPIVFFLVGCSVYQQSYGVQSGQDLLNRPVFISLGETKEVSLMNGEQHEIVLPFMAHATANPSINLTGIDTSIVSTRVEIGVVEARCGENCLNGDRAWKARLYIEAKRRGKTEGLVLFSREEQTPSLLTHVHIRINVD